VARLGLDPISRAGSGSISRGGSEPAGTFNSFTGYSTLARVC
jgi:hypothetical protein